MRPKLLLLAALLLAAPAAAQRMPEWRTAPEAEILLRPFAYEPNVIRLGAGQPVKLRFVNNGRTTLGFSAPAFFAAARIRPHDRAFLRGGEVRLAPGDWVTIALVPAPGRYRVRSRNLAHRLLGMSATIVVE
ncbi:MAG TPA: cupredoxin domain-containing protein [Allosphingosinicella sp.]|nr:cupredoxin domain-containing protein [Allosphingosinicella sp.]